MKRILITALLCVGLAISAGADMLNRDMLLADSGTLYAIESHAATDFPDLTTTSARVLTLTTTAGAESKTVFVPGSLNGGSHSDASLAYDSATDTLFIFWQKMPNAMSSELLFCAYHEGDFTEPTSIDDAAFHVRFNLRIGVSRYMMATDENGDQVRKPALSIHAIWWDETGGSESARYALINIENGQAAGKAVIRDLTDFVGSNGNIEPAPIDATFDRDFFRHPAIFETGTHDSVDVLFANWKTNYLEKVRITPVIGYTPEGVLHIPVGVWTGEIEPPQHGGRVRSDASRVSVIASQSGSSFVFYSKTDQGLAYRRFVDGKWSDEKVLALGESLSAEAGVDVLRRLATSE